MIQAEYLDDLWFPSLAPARIVIAPRRQEYTEAQPIAQPAGRGECPRYFFSNAGSPGCYQYPLCHA
ncbi:hypothetical protein [Keguizhuia sedimenti]|uniref:hypothetical protein n=1 Tax=Keguizhuia sedimenti TaxID=3064264 RepID=UPI003BAE3142